MRDLVNAAMDQPRPSAALTLALAPFVRVKPPVPRQRVPSVATEQSPPYRLLAIETPGGEWCRHKVTNGSWCREPATFWGQWLTKNRNSRVMYFKRALCREHARDYAELHHVSLPPGESSA